MSDEIKAAVIGAVVSVAIVVMGGYGWLRTRLEAGSGRMDVLETKIEHLEEGQEEIKGELREVLRMLRERHNVR